jgi:hypothetical protein
LLYGVENRKQTGNKNETEEKIGVRVVAFNAPFNNISVISWQSVLLVEETGVPGENHRPVARQCQTLSHKIRGRDRVVVEFTITCAISAYHHKGCEFESRS